ncbi:MAG: RAMP superfamily CRISPR-associated protein [Scytonema sp. PMC 1069.18]|nr:RAMP superfamily CRISPR-associated protein [Scytonema sp. PMC 1069.18]MEC4885709.1 RAMP superfamily CRISPR-associated protein [Scytonema sp. PMC 1070.18]
MTFNRPRPRSQPPTQPNIPANDSIPKPYELVSLPSVEPKRNAPVGQEKFRSDRISGKIPLTLTVKTTAFVASGVVAMGSDISNQTRNIPLIKTSVLRNQGVIIPGSSLKGVVRSIYEAITISCLCKTKADRTTIPNGYRECLDQKNLCPACQVFGAMGWQGLIRFPDAITTQTKSSTGFMPSLYAPRPKREAYYKNGKVAGRKFYYHTIKAVDKGQQKGIAVQQAGSEFIFSTQLHFMNLTLAELGTLFIVLGQDKPNNPIALKVGGGKPIGMGTMEIAEIHEIELLQTQQDWKQRYCNYIQSPENLTGNKLQDLIKQAIQAAHKTLVQAKQMEQLREVLKFPNDREAPEGMY